MKKAFCLVICAGAALAMARSALAIPPFYKEFENMYANGDDTYKALVMKEKCNICHDPKDKKIRNAYGQALNKLLDKKRDAKDVEKIKESLKTVENQKAKDDGPTYIQNIKAGKLPCAD